MSDFNSSLPVRTQTNGDVAVKVVDGTTVSQALAIDSSGRPTVKLDDGAGNAVTSQVNGAQRALDVGIDVAGVQVDPRSIRTLTSADTVSVVQSTSPWITKDQNDGSVTPGTAASFSGLIGGIFNTSPPTLTNGQQAAVQVDSSGRLLSAVTLLEDQNYGTVGATTLRTAAQIGNAAGAADFNAGATSAQTLRVIANQGVAATATNGWTVKPTDGTNSQAYLSTGEAKVSVTQSLPAGAALIGQVNLDVGGSLVSATNPVPVTITAATVGTVVNNYNTTAALASAATSNHTYTVTTSKTFQGKKIFASASGKLKVEVQTSPDGTTYSSVFVGFNSTANPNIAIDMDEILFLSSGTGSTVRIIRTNLDLLAQDVYSTICGVEI